MDTPRTALRALAALFIIQSSAFDVQGSTPEDRPNVLFIAVDDMRVQLGCYGDKHVHSPNIDRLAKRGTLFERAYCQQAVCNPSRTSLLTGVRPEFLGIWDLPTHFRQRFPAIGPLPQHFKAHGYHTENIGKIYHNWRQDDYKGDAPSWSVPAMLHYARHGDDKAETDGVAPADGHKTPKCEMRDVPDEAYFDGRVAASAVEALGRLKGQEQPFFLAVGFWKPHSHFNAPKKYWDLYDREKVSLPSNPLPPKDVPEIALHDSREILRSFKDRPDGKPTEREVIDLRHGYFANISYVDAQVGKVVAALDANGLADNTVIVFWSDHGFHLGEHGLWAKTSNFELDAHVPMIIAQPGQKEGRRARGLVELLDLYPTLVDLCGLPTPAHPLNGKSLVPLLNDPAATVKPAAYTWHPRPAYPPDGEAPKAMGLSVRTDRYRYTEWRNFADGAILARELYDHSTDPSETVNIAGLPEHAELIEKELSPLVPARR
jgi:iduronate 2-sulfatase